MEISNIKTLIPRIKTLFHNIRDTLSRDEINKIRTNIYKKEAIYDYLSKKDNLTSNEAKVLDNIKTYFNKLYADLLEQNKYQCNIYGLDLLFKEDDYYKPVEIKSAFNGNYTLYQSNGDKDGLLSIPKYFDKIKPY